MAPLSSAVAADGSWEMQVGITSNPVGGTMREGHASRTAEQNAFFRALDTVQPRLIRSLGASRVRHSATTVAPGPRSWSTTG